MSKDFEAQKQALMKEVRSVLAEVESLYESSAEAGSEQAKALKDKVQDQLAKAKSQLHDLEHTVVDKAKQTAARTDELVHEQPYYAMGAAAVAGLVLGLLLGGGCRRR
ncbi:ElaB/YqjD/DUF883 family membrane-anchored ribosome-binding protein [Neisseria sp. HSC-16F19]|nr:DUF883 family protein [Neisseria sp. HSC-16F19]MCP2040852.1 ElaB/YqjD/DUF883 family membrane-anchored ribosome-binding protein [Neisseria sp. HSC-16F19]